MYFLSPAFFSIPLKSSSFLSVWQGKHLKSFRTALHSVHSTARFGLHTHDTLTINNHWQATNGNNKSTSIWGGIFSCEIRQPHERMRRIPLYGSSNCKSSTQTM